MFFTLSTPLVYSFKTEVDFLDRFKNAAVPVNQLMLSANFDWNKEEKKYPDTFNSQVVLNNKVAINKSIAIDFKNQRLDLSGNIIYAVSPRISLGCHLAFDEKTRKVTLNKYALFLHLQKHTKYALEYIESS